MGDTLVHSASGLLWLMGRWGCGDRGSDLHQIHGSVCPADRTRAEPAPLGMDVSELDIGITHQPVAALGSATPTGSPINASPTKINSPAHLIWPLLRTRRIATSAS